MMSSKKSMSGAPIPLPPPTHSHTPTRLLLIVGHLFKFGRASLPFSLPYLVGTILRRKPIQSTLFESVHTRLYPKYTLIYSTWNMDRSQAKSILVGSPTCPTIGKSLPGVIYSIRFIHDNLGEIVMPNRTPCQHHSNHVRSRSSIGIN